MSLFSSRKWQLDTQAYLNTCNISSALPRQQIRDFAKGVNDLGLWDSMVCWPLRSTQNYGSGTTAFSLGGLGSYNGTLTGGPVWAADGKGITFDGSNDKIATTFSGLGANVARDLFVVAKASNQSLAILAAVHPTDVSSNSSNKPWGILQFSNATTWSAWTGLNAPSLATVTTGQFSSASFGYNGSAAYGYLNGSTVSVANETPDTYSPNSLTIGGPGGQNWFFNSDIAFVMLATTSSAPNLHALYKTTLGTGLGLP
jgi:hypothetical protein